MTSARKIVSLGLILGTTGLNAQEHHGGGEIDLSKLPPPAQQANVTYAKDIRPLFEASCFGCHGEEKQKGKIRLDSLEAVLEGGHEGKIVRPGDSQKSSLVIAVAQLDEETAMPPKPRRRGPGGPEGRGPGNGEQGERRDRPQDRGEDGAQGRRGGEGAPRNFGPPPKPLTPEQVGLIRAWIDQGAK